MNRLVRATVAGTAVCVLAGCGVRPTGVVSAGEAPTATATSLPRTQVYFLLQGLPHPVKRAVPPWDTQAVFDALLAGPTDQERARGLRTELTLGDMTIRAIDSKVVFVEFPPLAAKQTNQEKQANMARRAKTEAVGYLQISCTARGLPTAPLVKMPGIEARGISTTSTYCPGASSTPGPPGAELPSAEPFPSANGGLPQTKPPVLSSPSGGTPEKAPRRRPGPNPTG
ncbi:hypothetical protein NE236_22245 [Actinoallomurus purpureus]|uniref:hypothetical protein n=1 Tax=Actinoallomurus purpureus TaxID=478114 RepID=UPI00209344E0|nr:hypothetical protein [Actinoallomurus purpureus]MCO6007703.1 hypothetical protein [Actinoallomurus purpureus]